MKSVTSTDMTFWEHLDVLRASLIKAVIIVVAAGMAAFAFKAEVFSVILAPTESHFITYRLFDGLARSISGSAAADFTVRLFNIGLTEQFFIHIKTSLFIGLLVASPLVVYLLFRFISPALRANESRHSGSIITWGYAMFALGLSFGYYVVFPFTFRFLGAYTISPDIENTISLQSYMDTFMMMNLLMGIVFEIPLVCLLLAKARILTPTFMKHYRKHAIVAILVIAAIITPTSDVFTLLLVALPILILYECSLLLIKRVA